LVSPKDFKSANFDRSILKYDIQQLNEEGKRVYLTPTGNKYPSITTVMGYMKASVIAEWRRRVGNEEANRVSRKATQRGTSLHTLCEKYIDNQEDFGTVSPDALDLFKMIKPIIDSSIDNIYCQETRLYSDYIGVAGTVDCVAEFNGKKSIVDFKTARKIKSRDMIKDYFMQTSGYAVMFEELTGIPIPQVVIIMASEEGTAVFIENRDDWVSPLMNAVQVYNAVHT
jgi:genome maintenance exonuclease 1